MVDAVIDALVNQRVPFKRDVEAKTISKYKGGGRLDILAFPSTVGHLNSLSNIIRTFQARYFILGGASNLLVLDSGYSGLAISTVNIKGASVTDDILKAGSGEGLARLNRLALDNNLGGLEYLAGIPGTLGGAIYMNAGAFGCEIKDLVQSVSVYDIKKAKLFGITAENIDFSYRSSGQSFDDKIIVLAQLKLSKTQSGEMLNRMNVFASMRRNHQPAQPSLGCAFKNNNGLSAGFLIDSAGLKGTKLNGAEISTAHANFIVNTGGGTASDYIHLARKIKESVFKRFGITLAPEFIILGDEKEKREYLDLYQK